MSTTVRPKKRVKIVKKRKNPFRRYQSDRFMRVGTSWRSPKGIDSRLRRRFRGMPCQPKIGYGSAKATRHMLPNGFKKFRVRNVKDLEILLMHNQVYAADIAHSVGAAKRQQIITRAQQLNIRVLNAHARVETQDQA
eukprot:CAMPEP_0201546656 /NCGR_PEP_ID=MMETSP0173_2-20130828/2958_1 /ASSEMBLY_ACC=CAM_ASM_000268 /TAXON_ID=218659 /ORGANISM="Vexillifera sp., Strain DIVA3 564/2" /LENGTH=136 /DNA_ID=CAMNT_0047955393 /DNA_START=56 /DNA_END=466 /DNA_ORIENTATION=+